MKSRNKKILFYISVTCSLPILMCLFGVYYIQSFNINENYEKLEVVALKGLREIESCANSSEYLAMKLGRIFKNSKDSASLNNQMKSFSDKIGIKIRYLIWKTNSKLCLSNYNYEKQSGNAVEACETLYKCHVERKYDGGEILYGKEMKNLKKVFGDQFLIKHLNNFSISRHMLLAGDSSNVNRRYWLQINKQNIFIVFVDLSKNNEKLLLSFMTDSLNDKYSEVKFALSRNGNYIGIDHLKKDILDKFNLVNTIGATKLELKNHIIIPNYLDDETIAFAIINMGNNTVSEVMLRMIFISIFILIVTISLISKILSSKSRSQIKIRLRQKFIGLFILFNLIPLTIFLILGHNYLIQQKKVEISRIYNDGTRFLEHIDKLYISEITLQIKSMQDGLKVLGSKLKKDGITKENFTTFLHSLYPSPMGFSFIGSSSSMLVTERGIIKGNQKPIDIGIPLKDSNAYKTYKQFKNAIIKLQRLYILEFNKMHIPPKLVAETDFIIKAIGQSSTLAVMQKFYIQNETIFAFGFGKSSAHSFFCSLNLFDPNLVDYVLTYGWDHWALLISYIERLYSFFNKNPIDLKVMVVISDGSFMYPADLCKNKSILNYALRLTEDSGNGTVRECIWKGEKHYLMGFKGQTAKLARFVGLYPCNKIDRKINSMQQKFFLFGIIGFLISILFGLSVSREIMFPIKDLKVGITALKERNFNYQIPELGANEFGRLACIINETIEDHGELQRTDSLNSQLFPDLGRQISCNNITVYGDASVFSDSGKGYLDYSILMEKQKIGIFMGEINKIGVASTLLAAYLKSCSLVHKHLWNSPQLFVNNVEKLINKINVKDNDKISSFQYMTIDTVSNELEISGSDKNLPVILDFKNQKIRKGVLGKQAINNGEYIVAYEQEFASMNCIEAQLLQYGAIEPEKYYNTIFENMPVNVNKDFALVIVKVS